MTTKRRNAFEWALIETEYGHNGWVTNPKGFSLHMDDKVVLKSPASTFEGRIIRRTNEKQEWYVWMDTEIIATANQFPESGLPTQPELPVVSFPTVSDWGMKKKELHELTKTLENTIIQVRNLI